jgi:hypothetical protein
MLKTLQTNALVDRGGFPLWAKMDWWRSSLRIPAVYYTVSWPSLTLIWMYSHPIGCCSIFLLLPVLRTVFKCASWVIILMTTLLALWWRKWWPRFCYVVESDILDVTPVDPPGSVPFLPGSGVCVAMICWYWIGEENILCYMSKWNMLLPSCTFHSS